MWVRLTRAMIGFIDGLVTDACREELTFERQFSGERTVHIHAAFVAWEMARDAMAGVVFTETGAKQRYIPYTKSRALQKVAAGTNAQIKHAAMRDVAVIGHHAYTFPVWELPEVDEHGRRWWPSPIQGSRFVVLKPTWHDEGGSRLTTWGERGIEHRADRLNDEAVHWRVLG